MACPSALLILLALAGALGQPDLCEYETNRIKDLLQASCAGKGLTTVPSELDHQTGILLLGSNRLARVSTASFRPLRNLTDLDLSRNGLGELEAASPVPSLQELDLSLNALKSLPSLLAFPNLVRLALGHNALSRLPEGGFHALGQLVDLELQGNQLQRLPEGAFAGLAALKDLDLSDNRLVALPPELLAGLTALNTLRLERNRLRSLPEGFFPEGQLFAYVYLIGNPWLCDCALEYLSNWINENSFSVYTRVQGPEKEITENEPENVTCHNPPEKLGHPIMDAPIDFHLECRSGGLRGDGEEIVVPQTDPGQTISDVLSTLFSPTTITVPTATEVQTAPAPSPPELPPAPTTATPPALSPTTATPSPLPTTLDSLAATVPTATEVQTAPAPSPPELPPAPTTATPPALSPTTATPSPSPTTLDSLAATVPTATEVQTAPAPSPPELPPGSTTTTSGPGATPSTPPRATSTTPAPTPTALVLPATALPACLPVPPPPATCQCPMLPGVAFGLTGPRPSPVSWRAWLAAYCCPLRLALYVACLVLVSLPALAMLCWWVCVSVETWYPPATSSALGPRLVKYQQLQNEAHERRPVPGEGRLPLPGRRLYRVCKRLDVAPLRYVTWLLVSLPGPSGQWPWERKAHSPWHSLDQGKDTLGAGRVKYASATL